MIKSKSIILTTLLLLASSLMAQPGRSARPAMPRVDVSIHAAGEEAFVVYVDGIPVQSRSEHATDFSIEDRDQTLYIRLKRPEDRIVSFDLYRGRIHPHYVVRYNAQRDEVVVESAEAPRMPPPPEKGGKGGKHRQSAATNADVQQLVKDLKKPLQRDEMMNMAKLFISQATITTDQAMEIAKAFSFDDDKTDILIYAYDFCSDKKNYRRTVEAVTFSANKERLFEFLTKHR